MIDLLALNDAVRAIEREMGERGVSRATSSKCDAFRASLQVLASTRQQQDRNNS